MAVLVTCENEDDPIKNHSEGGTVAILFRIISHWGFSQMLKCSLHRSLCRIWPNFDLIRDFMVILIKNEGARVATKLNIDFSDAQWQFTP